VSAPSQVEAPSDGELIQRVKDGDLEAFGRLYDRHSGRVWTLIRRVLGNDTTADDAAQETWLNVVRAIRHFRGDAEFATWLHRVALNTSMRVIRSDRTRHLALELLARESSALFQRPPDSDPFLRDRIMKAIDALPDGMRRVLVLHDVEGLSHEEIAGLLGVQPVTSRTQLARARLHLRRVLSSDNNPTEGIHASNGRRAL
jgi:RNA polymerase sigma-70 factor, ECF subfamily